MPTKTAPRPKRRVQRRPQPKVDVAARERAKDAATKTDESVAPIDVETKTREEARLAALNDESRRYGPNGGSLAREGERDEKPKRVTFLSEAEDVLRAQDEPMKVTAITEAVLARGKFVTKGKTPAATLGVLLSKSARFEKTGPGEYRLV